MSKHRFDIARKMKADFDRRQKLHADRERWHSERVNREHKKAEAYKKEIERLERHREQIASAKKAARWKCFSDEVKRIKEMKTAMDHAKSAQDLADYHSYLWSIVQPSRECEPWAETTGSFDIISALEERT